MKQAVTFFLLIGAVFLLLSCTADMQPTTDPSANTSGHSGSETSSHNGSKSDIDWLQTKGVSVDRLGDHVMIIIPSHLIFDGYSVHLSGSSDVILNMIAKIIKPMGKERVNVAAYSPSLTQSKKDLLVTGKQADIVGKYLWRQGISSRLIYAVGYGGGHPVKVGENNANIDSINYRVVITLQQMTE